jgi:hypothetical protein
MLTGLYWGTNKARQLSTCENEASRKRRKVLNERKLKKITLLEGENGEASERNGCMT